MPSGKIFALQGEEIVAKLIYVFTVHLHAKAAMQDTVILFALTRKSPVNICFVYFLCIEMEVRQRLGFSGRDAR